MNLKEGDKSGNVSLIKNLMNINRTLVETQKILATLFFSSQPNKTKINLTLIATVLDVNLIVDQLIVQINSKTLSNWFNKITR